MLLFAMTTATFAGSGVTATIQNRTVQVEVTDTNLYDVTVVSETKGFINGLSMNRETGAFRVEIPQSGDSIKLLVTNLQTGATEILHFNVE